MMMRRGTYKAVLGAVAVCALGAGPAAAQQGESTGEGREFSLSPAGYVQIDFRTFPDWGVAPGTGRLNRGRGDMRRLRAGIEGGWRRVAFEFTVDPTDADGTLVKDAYVGVRLGKGRRLRAGQFKVPGSREYDVAARRTDFLERTTLGSQMAAGRDIGAMVEGRVREVGYSIGVFAGDGNGRRERAGLTAAARAVWEPVAGLELGACTSVSRTGAAESEPANGLDGRSPAGYRFFERLYVQGRRARVGGDVEWTRGPWRVSAEGLQVTDERRGQGVDHDDLPQFLARAWTFTASRRFGTPRRTPAEGAALGRTERWPWQLALRYEQVRFDDAGPAGSGDSVRPRAADVRPRGVDSIAAALSRELTEWLRLIGDASVEYYTDARSAPAAGRRGSYLTAGIRFQLQIP